MGSSQPEQVREYIKLKPIDSLGRLEEVRKELCEKYNTKDLYITNKSGEWEIKYTGFAHYTGDIIGNIEDYENEDYIKVEKMNPYISSAIYHSLNNHYLLRKDLFSNIGKSKKLYVNWKNNGKLITEDLLYNIDLKEEGYEIKI